MNITLVISSLGGGGAERVMWHMANYWVERGRRVTLITLYSNGGDFYVVDSRVKRVDLGLGQASSNFFAALGNNLRRLYALRRAISDSNPDGIISFMPSTNVLVALAARHLGVPVIVSERIDPTQERAGAMWEFLRKLVYPRASCLVVQTHAVAKWAEQAIPGVNTAVIPNPVVASPIIPVERAPTGEKVIMALGRLTPQKGFDLLISSFAQCCDRFPGWTLRIWGEGAQRVELEALIEKLDMTGRIHLPGTTKEPLKELASSDLFVLSSRYEGFPNALLEAMMCGLPVISFDCPSGPGDIIDHGVNGLLVSNGDIAQLTSAMEVVMTNECLAKNLAAEAKKITGRFSIDNVMGQWEALLQK